MAMPPTYADLAKSARDVVTKGYGFFLIKLDLKTKSKIGLEFTSSGSASTETTKVNGSLETKHRVQADLCRKWTQTTPWAPRSPACVWTEPGH
uniref:Non-selective voltage-gated ion channel VDAC1 n=1 Tax=Peromyscus maniculatus bairdii TaxID=230844 RepID=A0A8C8W238_PERMB